MILDKKTKRPGLEIILKYRDALIIQYERNNKWESFDSEVEIQLA